MKITEKQLSLIEGTAVILCSIVMIACLLHWGNLWLTFFFSLDEVSFTQGITTLWWDGLATLGIYMVNCIVWFWILIKTSTYWQNTYYPEMSYSGEEPEMFV